MLLLLLLLWRVGFVLLFPLLLEQEPQPLAHLGEVLADWGHGGTAVAKYLTQEKVNDSYYVLLFYTVLRPIGRDQRCCV